jgi:hypothetical protein
VPSQHGQGSKTTRTKEEETSRKKEGIGAETALVPRKKLAAQP